MIRDAIWLVFVLAALLCGYWAGMQRGAVVGAQEAFAVDDHPTAMGTLSLERENGCPRFCSNTFIGDDGTVTYSKPCPENCP